MNAQMVLTVGQDALLMLLMVSSPVLGAALVVGLLVSLFQIINGALFLNCFDFLRPYQQIVLMLVTLVKEYHYFFSKTGWCFSQ